MRWELMGVFGEQNTDRYLAEGGEPFAVIERDGRLCFYLKRKVEATGGVRDE